VPPSIPSFPDCREANSCRMLRRQAAEQAQEWVLGQDSALAAAEAGPVEAAQQALSCTDNPHCTALPWGLMGRKPHGCSADTKA